jgi:hypothetical protein
MLQGARLDGASTKAVMPCRSARVSHCNLVECNSSEWLCSLQVFEA